MYYMAPELKTGKYGTKSDIYGLGMIAAKMFLKDEPGKIRNKMKKNNL